jgi:hypothetical protein
MRQILISLLLFQTAIAAEPGGRAEYVGGTVSRFSAGDDGRIHTLNETAMVFTTKKASIGVPYERINLLEYGQNASRRVILAAVISPLFLLSKSRKHFLTIGYQDDKGKQQALVLRVDKGQVRAVLVSLEARTGLRVEFQDTEARKAGKG